MTTEMKTSTMKLSDVRPCDFCDGKIAPIFYTMTIKLALFSPKNTNRTLGLTQFLGSLALAEAMGAEDPVVISEESDTTYELFICNDCCNGINSSKLDFSAALEKIRELHEKKEAENASK